MEIYVEPRICELCDELIKIDGDQISEIWRMGTVSHYHLACWEAIIRSDLLETEDIRIDASEAETEDLR